MNQMIRWLLTAFFIELILISDVSKETSPILDPQTLTSDILNRRGKNLCHFVRKMGKEKKKKNNRYCKALCVNIQTQKFTIIFENICILVIFYFTGVLKF